MYINQEHRRVGTGAQAGGNRTQTAGNGSIGDWLETGAYTGGNRSIGAGNLSIGGWEQEHRRLGTGAQAAGNWEHIQAGTGSWLNIIIIRCIGTYSRKMEQDHSMVGTGLQPCGTRQQLAGTGSQVGRNRKIRGQELEHRRAGTGEQASGKWSRGTVDEKRSIGRKGQEYRQAGTDAQGMEQQRK